MGQVTVKVVDEEGRPVAGASVGIGFSDPTVRNQETAVRGVTDALGAFSASARADGGGGFGVDKKDYYRSTGDFGFSDIKSGRWQPWNPTLQVIMKKIINPVPMYAKQVNLGIPVFDNPVGFDLLEGDWAVPNGKGKVSDFVFHAKLQKRSDLDFDYTLTLTFPNPADGLQPFEVPDGNGSELKSPHQAPEQGYLPQWVQLRSKKLGTPGKNTRDMKRNYFFRVRSSVDKAGNVTRALYGKIYGDFMYFTYYVNPDGTRNIEFDMKRNLLKNLKSWEEPKRP
jgi:hypothetical protein